MTNNILLATSNNGKLKEIKHLFADLPYEFFNMQDFKIDSPEETGLSFIENAVLKARHASQFFDGYVLADDSGLVVPALNGEPGIYSARYSGEEATDYTNNLKLLEKIKHLSLADRQAYMICVMVLMRFKNDPDPVVGIGRCHGVLLDELRGTGFGYDPLFFIEDKQATFGEMGVSEKAKISHRYKALMAIKEYLLHVK